MHADSVAVLDTGAAGVFGALRLPHACARFKFGDGCLGEVRRAAAIPAKIAGDRGKFATFAPEVDYPVFLRRGALEPPGRQLGFTSGNSPLRK